MNCSRCGAQNSSSCKFCVCCGYDLLSNGQGQISTIDDCPQLRKYGNYLKVINFFVMFPLMFNILVTFIILFGTLFIAALVEPFANTSYESFLMQFSNVFLPEILAKLFVVLVINVIFAVVMNKENKKCVFVGQYRSIKKVKYILLAILFGIYGIHKFAIGNKKSGIFRLALLFLSALSIALIGELGVSVLTTFVLFVTLNSSLLVSDIFIAISRVKDQNDMIYVE